MRSETCVRKLRARPLLASSGHSPQSRAYREIEAMLDEPGTVLIAVGAGHLAGPDSVITLLEAEGHEVTGP